MPYQIWASKIQNTSKAFEDFLFPIQNNLLTFEEFEKAFILVKCNKVAGHVDIDSHVISKFMMKLTNHHLWFPEQLKNAKVSPIFKAGNIGKIGNYRPISVLHIFSKVLERIMYSRT